MSGWIVAIAIAIAVWLVAIGVLMVLGRGQTARQVATIVPNLVILFRGLLKDPRVPWGTRAWVWVAVVWLISPIDLIPEFIPVAGPLDDIIVAGLVLRHVVRTTERAVLDEHWRGEASTLDAIVRSWRSRTRS